MDPKKKTKIWIIVFIITLSAAGGLAVLLSKRSTLFKGSIQSSSALTITLDPTITNQTITPGWNGYVTGFRLANTSATPINILAFNLNKTGTLENSKIEHLTLHEKITKQTLGSEILMVSNTATVRWEAPRGDILFTIPAGATAQFVVKATVNNTAAANKNFYFSVNSKIDVGISGSNFDPVASPSYPLQGPTITVNAQPPPPPAAATVAIANPPGWTNSDEIKRAGDVDATFGKFQLTAASNMAILPLQLALTKTGTLPDNRLTSLRLFKNGSAVAAVQKGADNKWKNVGNTPIGLLANIPVELELKGIIVRGDGGYDFTFSIGQQPAGGLNITSGTPFNLKHITVIGTEDLPQANKTEPANNSTVSTLTPALRWNTTGIPGGSKPFHFRWAVDDVTGAQAITVLRREFNWEDGAPGNTAPPNFPRKCPANAIVPGLDNPWTCQELQIPPGVLQYNHRYRWFVHVNNGDQWTPWCSAGHPHPYCTGDVYFNFTTPPPPTVTVTASRPAGQSEQIPAIANQTVKLATINISQSGGDPMLTRLKRIVLEYQTADSPLEINKITDLHLFRGDSSEFTLGTTGKDLIILSKNSVNGTIEAVFQTVTPVSVIGDPRNQNITLYAKINGVAGDNGKKIKYVLKSVEFEPGDGNQTNLNIAVPELTMHEDPPDAPQATFQTSPAGINRGQSSTLSWNVTNATTITIDNGIGTVSGVGTRVVNPTTDTTYTLTASNAGGEVTRTAVVAVAQPSVAPPSPPPGGGTPAPQTCEQQGLKTYTGPPKPGERVTGMCIACTTEQYIANGGTCETKKKKKVGNMDAGLPRAGGGQGAGAAGAAATGGAAAGAISAQPQQGGQRGAAPEQTPNLQGSQRLVRAPERANTGPETLVYLGILGVVHAGLWLRKKIKHRQ